jgi:hypothetical protein
MLMEITYIIVVGLITLAVYLIFDYFFPRRLIYHLIKNQLYRVNDITVEFLKVYRLQLATIFFNSRFDVFGKILFAYE